MRVECGCGHQVTMNVQPEREKFWSHHAKECMCVNCYKDKTGKSVGTDTVLVKEIDLD